MSDSKPPPPTVEPETYDAGPTWSSDDPTFKFYQIAVPHFSFNQTGDQTGVTRTVPNVSDDKKEGSSFLRMGSFPDVTQRAKGPAGFAESLHLANFIGNPATIVTAMDSSP